MALKTSLCNVLCISLPLNAVHEQKPAKIWLFRKSTLTSFHFISVCVSVCVLITYQQSINVRQELGWKQSFSCVHLAFSSSSGGLQLSYIHALHVNPFCTLLFNITSSFKITTWLQSSCIQSPAIVQSNVEEEYMRSKWK